MIGTALRRRMEESDWRIYCQSRTIVSAASSIQWVRFDLADPAFDLTGLPAFDVVFHLAGQTSTYAARQDPSRDLLINTAGFVKLLNQLRKQSRQPFVVFAGTATQVGLTDVLPIDEGRCDHPATFYDISKLAAEMYLKQFVAEGWLAGCSLRLANVYGYSHPTQSAERGILDKVFKAALRGAEITIYGDGNYLRDYIFIEDVVSALLAAPAHKEKVNGGHFLVGSGQGISLKDAFARVVDLAAQITGTRARVVHVDPPKDISGIEFRNAIMDTSAYRGATGWAPAFDLAAGLRAAYGSYLGSGV